MSKYTITTHPGSGGHSPPMMAEQDFILSIRRMHRLNMPRIFVNIVRNITDYGEGDTATDPSADAFKAFVESVPGDYHMMNNGDVFAALPIMDDQKLLQFRRRAGEMLMPQEDIKHREESMVSYTLPQDYTALRERANMYVELARAVEVMGPIRQAESNLRADDVRGPLTAWSLSQVEQLLNTIDIKRYVHTQPVYEQVARGVWEKKYTDFYVSLTELQRERFPRLVLNTPERLFLDLCCTLDRKLFQELGNQSDNWKTRRISINMSAETVLSSVFAQFCHILPNERRKNVCFDIHRSDLFLNFSTTRNAISVLKAEGFMTGIDGITPSTLPYINFGMFDVSHYKITVTREKLPELKEKPAREALAKIDTKKIIFNQCDSEEALRFGQELGVTHYQGWLIDDVANTVIQ